MHMWVARQGRTSKRRPYSDNLKDANDESLRTIATKLFGTLSGVAQAARSWSTPATAAATCSSTGPREACWKAAWLAST